MRFFFILLPIFLIAQNLSFPPMPPSLPQKENKSKPKLPKECEIIPPMLIFLPPPLEKDLKECKNKLYMPTIKMAKKALLKKNKDIKIKKISIVDGFEELYEIDTNRGRFYCNKKVTKCFRVKDE